MSDDDGALLEAWGRGDLRAADTLLRRYFGELWRFFRNKVDDATEEMIQRTMTALLDARTRFRGESSVRTYLFQIAKWQLYRFYEERRRNRDRIDWGSVSVRDMGASPSSVMAHREQERALLVALRRIPLELQILVELHYWEDLKMTEIAAVLEIPVGTVKSRLRRAKERLQAALVSVLEDKDLLSSTLEDLDGWANRLRDAVVRG